VYAARQAAAARQPGRAYAQLVASGLMADTLTEQLAALGIDDTSSMGAYVSGCCWCSSNRAHGLEALLRIEHIEAHINCFVFTSRH